MEALGIDLINIIIYTLNFFVVLFLLQRFAFTPVRNMLERRRQEIESGLSAAEKAQQEAASQRAQFEKELANARQASMAEAKKAAEATEKMRQEILAAAQKEADQIKAKARDDAEQERQQVMTDIRKQTAELAMQMTRKVVGDAVDRDAQKRLVTKFLADLGDVS